ncbi:hypothetical protein EV421DRAFT_1888838 [Armillaria borealis]|uniref:Uncharacterized protein n=1 Tax=Armillaria borealis TaxID=47425 RepID=A0AA39JYS1_9AGAR|nr:hypothetical protein EV421DRAFT_1888838 [Armillaria borealis]
MLCKSNLKGFLVPNLQDRILTSLFASDTTVFLSENDDFLFNIGKTALIPVGIKEYRDKVVSMRQLSPLQDVIGTERILGTWIGNNADSTIPWIQVIKKINQSLEQWEKSHPTIEGRQLDVIIPGQSSGYA